MKVYVLETGICEDRVVRGVFQTPEAAMAHWHPERPPGLAEATISFLYAWVRHHNTWEFDGNFDDYAVLHPRDLGP